MSTRAPILGPWVEVRRPWLLALVAAAAMASAGLTMAGLVGLAGSLRAEPATVAIADEQLSDALNDAPWVDAGGQGPVVWVVAAARCDGCAQFHQQDLPRLEAAGLRVRIIMVSRREDRHPELDAWTAAFAEARDPTMLVPLKAARALPQPPPDDPAEVEGNLEWGRASYDRIAAIVARNGGRMRMPALFWRRGAEWRAAIGRDAHLADRVLLELAPGA
jgi:hypothetical protein